MLGHTFYHGFLSKYVVILGTLFNDIKIERMDEDGKTETTHDVPIGYGPREHFLARIEEDPKLNRPFSMAYPRIAFQLETFEYDGDRKLMTTHSYQQLQTSGNKSAVERVFMPVPYNFNFKMWVMAKNPEDAHKVVEQIVPYFTPDWTVSAALIEDMPDYVLDIPIVLSSAVPIDEYESNFLKRRTCGWELSFTLKGYLFGPVSKSKIIKIAKVNFYLGGFGDTTIDERLTVRPGLTANGEPTTVEEESVPVSEIDEFDNYGYIVKIENGE